MTSKGDEMNDTSLVNYAEVNGLNMYYEIYGTGPSRRSSTKTVGTTDGTKPPPRSVSSDVARRYENAKAVNKPDETRRR
jgi:hypothetical protein